MSGSSGPEPLGFHAIVITPDKNARQLFRSSPQIRLMPVIGFRPGMQKEHPRAEPACGSTQNNG
jgi:hypothetical protein